MYKYLFILLFGIVFLASCSSPKKRTSHSSRTKKEVKSPVHHDFSSQERRQIVKIAEKLVGSPYKYGAEGPRRFDCSGFTNYVYRQVGLQLPRTSAQQASIGKKLRKDQIEVGDLLVFYKGSRVQHVGICVARKEKEIWAAHASSSKGVVVEEVMQHPYWKSRFREGRRVVR